MRTSANAGRRRPELRLELEPLGLVDPFRLKVREDPPGSGSFFACDPAPAGSRTTLDYAGLHVLGAGQALLALAFRWMVLLGREVGPGEPPPMAGEVRLVVRRKEARLLGGLLRRHLKRLSEPPRWMPDLLRSFEEIDEFLRWEEV